MLHLIAIVKFILSSISSRLLFRSVNHTLISLHSELNVFNRYDLLEKFLKTTKRFIWNKGI